MENLIDYHDLDRHFHVPKTFLKQYSFFMFPRLPRKLKKRIKKMYFNTKTKGDMNLELWYLMQKENINYHRFIIKKICEHYK